VDLDMATVDYGKMPEDAEELDQVLDDLPPEPEPKDEADGWAREAWDWCKRNGYITSSRPHDTVTMQMLAAVLYRVETDGD
jgi:hypothetical protein